MPRFSDVSVQLFRILQNAQHCDLYRQVWLVTFVKFKCSRHMAEIQRQWVPTEFSGEIS